MLVLEVRMTYKKYIEGLLNDFVGVDCLWWVIFSHPLQIKHSTHHILSVQDGYYMHSVELITNVERVQI